MMAAACERTHSVPVPGTWSLLVPHREHWHGLVVCDACARDYRCNGWVQRGALLLPVLPRWFRIGARERTPVLRVLA